MAGLWSKDPATPEGKFPIVLRRDGTPLEKPYFVLVLHDPAAAPALRAYADEAERRGWDAKFVADLRASAAVSEQLSADPDSGSDPDAPPHRTDDPAILAWARSIKSPSL